MPERPVVRQTPFPAEHWLGTEAVAAMLALEQGQAAREIAAAYGQFGVYLRPSIAGPFALEGHRMHQLLRLHRQGDRLAGDLCCRDNALPIASGAVALAYVQHVLESAVDAEALIAELARVLAPEGIAAFIVFNPWRPLRLRWATLGLHAIAAGRLAALLVERGLEVRGVRPLGVCWRVAADLAVDDGSDAAPVALLAGSYLLIARKRVHGVTPLRASGQRVGLSAGVGAG